MTNVSSLVDWQNWYLSSLGATMALDAINKPYQWPILQASTMLSTSNP